jgi:hypothetical protein
MLLPLFLVSCIATPVPVEQDVLEGRRYTDSDLQFVHTGVTARDELIRNLGPPTTWLPAQRILIYGLREVQGTGFVWFVASPAGSGAGGMVKGERREAIFFTLDDRGLVTQWGRAPVKRGETWSGAASAWSRAAGLSLPQPRPVFVEESPASTEQGLIFFYRPMDYQYYLPLLPPAKKLMAGVADFVNIYQDGALVAQLRWKTYVVVAAATGEHTFLVSADTDEVVNPELFRTASLRLTVVPQSKTFVDVGIEAGKGVIKPVLVERSRDDAINVIGSLRESW